MGQTDRQTDGRTPDRCIDPAPHTMRAVPTTEEKLNSDFYSAFLLAECARSRLDHRVGLCVDRNKCVATAATPLARSPAKRSQFCREKLEIYCEMSDNWKIFAIAVLCLV